MPPTSSSLTWACLALAVAGAAAGGDTPPAADPGPRAAERGADLFRIYCASCHGPAGRGDGPAAGALKVRPPDLTRLERRHDGAFPEPAVRAAIDGRTAPTAHGSEMPIWGLSFQDPGSDRDQEGEVRARIDWLVEFLRSIQDGARAADP